jgi:alpha-1,6-mannosyltransferase
MTEDATPKRLSTNRIAFVLIVLGVALLVFYQIGRHAVGAKDIVWFLKLAGVQATLYLAAVWLSLRGRDSRSVFIIGLVLAVLFRLSILFSPPYLSDDIYRYVWDGRVQAAGINPYRYVPADQSLAELRDEKIYPKINRRDYAPTIYPPVAEAVYFLTTRVSESVTWMKATMVGIEAVAVWAIIQLLASFGLPRERILIYTWHPLVVWEFAGSGHVDAIAIAFITLALLARRKNMDFLAGATVACAALVKFFPLVLLPALYKRWSWKMPLAFAITIVVAYLPYLSVGPRAAMGFLPGYANEQGLINGEQFYVLSLARKLLGANVPNVAFMIFALAFMSAIAAWMLFKDRGRDSYVKHAALLATGVTVLFAPHFSWYFAWLVPFLCFVPRLSLFYITAASFILYGTWLGDSPDQMFRLNSFLYLPFVLLVVTEFLTHRRKIALTKQPLPESMWSD